MIEVLVIQLQAAPTRDHGRNGMRCGNNGSSHCCYVRIARATDIDNILNFLLQVWPMHHFRCSVKTSFNSYRVQSGHSLSIVRPEDSPQAQSECIRDYNQLASAVWERMLRDEGEQ